MIKRDKYDFYGETYIIIAHIIAKAEGYLYIN